MPKYVLNYNSSVLKRINVSFIHSTYPNKCSSQTLVLFSLQQHTTIVIHAPLWVNLCNCVILKKMFFNKTIKGVLTLQKLLETFENRLVPRIPISDQFGANLFSTIRNRDDFGYALYSYLHI